MSNTTPPSMIRMNVTPQNQAQNLFQATTPRGVLAPHPSQAGALIWLVREQVLQVNLLNPMTRRHYSTVSVEEA